MNKGRRKEINKAIDKLTALKEAHAALLNGIDEVKSDIESIRIDEQDYIDNMAENLKGGEKAQAAEEAVGLLDDVMQELETLDEALNATDPDSLSQKLDEAKGGPA